jgi:hypothetical protein
MNFLKRGKTPILPDHHLQLLEVSWNFLFCDYPNSFIWIEYFVSCTNYPECKSSFSLPNETETATTLHDQPCSKCTDGENVCYLVQLQFKKMMPGIGKSIIGCLSGCEAPMNNLILMRNSNVENLLVPPRSLLPVPVSLSTPGTNFRSSSGSSICMLITFIHFILKAIMQAQVSNPRLCKDQHQKAPLRRKLPHLYRIFNQRHLLERKSLLPVRPISLGHPFIRWLLHRKYQFHLILFLAIKMLLHLLHIPQLPRTQTLLHLAQAQVCLMKLILMEMLPRVIAAFHAAC